MTGGRVAADSREWGRVVLVRGSNRERKGVHMRIKSFFAASGVLAILAAFLAFPASAQQKSGSVAPVCAKRHEENWKAIDLTTHGAKNDAEGSMCQACHGNAAEAR